MKRLVRYSLAAVAALAAISVGCAVTQLFGNHAFSASDFEQATGQPLPASARILKSESSDWDLHGDHDACALVEVSPQDYERLRSAMRPGPNTAPSTAPCSKDMYAVFARYTVLVAESVTVEGGSFRHWALAAGQPIVMVQYASW